MSSQPKTRFTDTEYLAIERAADFKSEYHAGEIFAMAGASLRHNQVVANLVGEAREQLKDGPCQIFPSDLRLQVSSTGLYTYPDAMVVCGEPKFLDDQFDTLTNPTVIFEVLSESTESYDRGTKFRHYRNLASLQSYVLITQDRFSVEVFSKTDSGDWLLTDATDADAEIQIQSINVDLPLSELYRNVKFDAAENESRDSD